MCSTSKFHQLFKFSGFSIGCQFIYTLYTHSYSPIAFHCDMRRYSKCTCSISINMEKLFAIPILRSLILQSEVLLNHSVNFSMENHIHIHLLSGYNFSVMFILPRGQLRLNGFEQQVKFTVSPQLYFIHHQQ